MPDHASITQGLCKDYRERTCWLVPVGLTSQSFSPSLPYSGPLEELPLSSILHGNTFSLCFCWRGISVLLLATHQMLLLSFMLLLALLGSMINWIIDMDQLERDQVFCHLRLCSVPRPCRSHACTSAILAQIRSQDPLSFWEVR